MTGYMTELIDDPVVAEEPFGRRGRRNCAASATPF